CLGLDAEGIERVYGSDNVTFDINMHDAGEKTTEVIVGNGGIIVIAEKCVRALYARHDAAGGQVAADSDKPNLRVAVFGRVIQIVTGLDQAIGNISAHDDIANGEIRPRFNHLTQRGNNHRRAGAAGNVAADPEKT